MYKWSSLKPRSENFLVSFKFQKKSFNFFIEKAPFFIFTRPNFVQTPQKVKKKPGKGLKQARTIKR